MIRTNTHIILSVFLSLITLLVVFAMINDNNSYPPLEPDSPGYDYVGNYEGSLINHIILVVIGFVILLYVTLRIKRKLPVFLRIILVLLFITNAIWAWSSIMHMGGIAVLYAFWSLFLVLFLAVCLFISGRFVKKSHG